MLANACPRVQFKQFFHHFPPTVSATIVQSRADGGKAHGYEYCNFAPWLVSLTREKRWVRGYDKIDELGEGPREPSMYSKCVFLFYLSRRRLPPFVHPISRKFSILIIPPVRKSKNGHRIIYFIRARRHESLESFQT